MTPQDIERLSRAAQKTGITELELAQDGWVLKLSIEGATSPTPPTAPANRAVPAGPAPIVSPSLGIFHHRHPLTGRAVSEAGQFVGVGEVVGYVVVDACVMPVVAPRDGMMGEPMEADGTVVGYGAPLYPLSES